MTSKWQEVAKSIANKDILAPPLYKPEAVSSWPDVPERQRHIDIKDPSRIIHHSHMKGTITMPPKQEYDPVQNQTRNQQQVDSPNAWLLGSSVASLASAVYLTRDTKVPASWTHLIKTRRALEDGITITGDLVSGYDYRVVFMPSLSDICIDALLISVTSAPKSGKDNTGKAKTGPASMRLFI